MKTIYLIRHTTPDVAAGTCYGSSDVPINGTFGQESEKIKKSLGNFVPEVVYSSPLFRCKVLSNELFGEIETHFDERLKEMDFGEWEMRKWDEIDVDILNSWAKCFWDAAAPAGESFSMLHDRVMEVWQKTIISGTQTNLAVVCHSGVIRSIIMALLQIPPNKIFNVTLPYGAVVKITWHDETVHQLQFV